MDPQHYRPRRIRKEIRNEPLSKKGGSREGAFPAEVKACILATAKWIPTPSALTAA